MMGAGNLDRRIELQRSVPDQTDAFNEPVDVWSRLARVWSEKLDLSDGERAAADQVGSFRMSRFKVRSTKVSRTVTPADRILYDDLVWNIHGVKETKDGRKRFLELTAATDTDPEDG